MGQMEQDQRLPFASEHKQGSVQAAGKGFLFHLHAILEWYLPKGAYWKRRMQGLTLAIMIHALRTPWADLKERSRSSPARTVASAWQAQNGSSRRGLMFTLPGAARRNWTKRSRRSGTA